MEELKNKISAKKVIRTAIWADVIDISINFIAAFTTGSVVMIVETMQGIAELISDLFILIGIKRMDIPADKKHPFGYGRETYFWTFFSAVILVTILAGTSIFLGWRRLMNPQEVRHIILAFFVLFVSLIVNGYSFSVGARRLGDGSFLKAFSNFRDSSLAETKATFVFDGLGTVAAFIGFISIGIYHITGDLVFDGFGALLIGFVMFIFGFVLVFSIKSMLIGKSVSEEILSKIKKTTLGVKGVLDVLDLKAISIGPDRILVNIEIHAEDNLTTDQIEVLSDLIKEKIKQSVPSAFHIQVELETP
jgi:cation diffusion facilitator family transporter